MLDQTTKGRCSPELRKKTAEPCGYNATHEDIISIGCKRYSCIRWIQVCIPKQAVLTRRGTSSSFCCCLTVGSFFAAFCPSPMLTWESVNIRLHHELCQELSFSYACMQRQLQQDCEVFENANKTIWLTGVQSQSKTSFLSCKVPSGTCSNRQQVTVYLGI